MAAIGRDDFAIPVSGIFYGALLRLVVHVDQTEAVFVTFIPLEVIHDGLGIVSEHGGIVTPRIVKDAFVFDHKSRVARSLDVGGRVGHWITTGADDGPTDGGRFLCVSANSLHRSSVRHEGVMRGKQN